MKLEEVTIAQNTKTHSAFYLRCNVNREKKTV